MYNLLPLILIVLLVVITFIYLERNSKRRDKAEEKRFREFVIASKSDGTEEYVTALPADDEELPSEPEDDLVDLDQVDPKTLLKAIKKNEDN